MWWHACNITNIISVVFEHELRNLQKANFWFVENPKGILNTRKYAIFQNMMVDFVHWLETSSIFPTY